MAKPILKPTAKPKPAPVKVKAPPKKTGMAGLYGGLGPTGYVNQLYAPQEQYLAQQQAARQALLTALTSQFADSLKGLGSQLAPYEAAANGQSAQANAAAASLAAANPNAQAQADLAAINAPQAQKDQVAQTNQTVFGGGAALLQETGGAIPADVFRADAAGRGAYLASLPLLGQSIGAQGLNHILALGSQEHAALAQQKAQSLQQATQNLADFMAKKQSNQISQAAVLGNLLGYVPPGLLGNKKPVGTLAGQKAKVSARQGAARIGIARTNANTSQLRATDAQLNADRSYNLAVQRYYGIDVPRLKLAQTKATAATKSGGLTSTAKARIAEKAARDAEDLYHGTTKPNPQDPNNPTILTYTQTYQDAIKTLLNRYPSLGVAGVIKLVNQWYQPGQYGRPEGAAPPIKLFGALGGSAKKVTKAIKKGRK